MNLVDMRSVGDRKGGEKVASSYSPPLHGSRPYTPLSIGSPRGWPHAWLCVCDSGEGRREGRKGRGGTGRGKEGRGGYGIGWDGMGWEGRRSVGEGRRRGESRSEEERGRGAKTRRGEGLRGQGLALTRRA